MLIHSSHSIVLLISASGWDILALHILLSMGIDPTRWWKNGTSQNSIYIHMRINAASWDITHLWWNALLFFQHLDINTSGGQDAEPRSNGTRTLHWGSPWSTESWPQSTGQFRHFLKPPGWYLFHLRRLIFKNWTNSYRSLSQLTWSSTRSSALTPMLWPPIPRNRDRVNISTLPRIRSRWSRHLKYLNGKIFTLAWSCL